MFESSVIVAYESLSCPRCEKMYLKNHVVIIGKGLNTQKILENHDLSFF